MDADEKAYAVPNGEVRYQPINADALEAGQRVALFVHGFQSDTRAMVAGPIPWLAQQGIAYDHILTFDYETYSTHIESNGKDLYNALKAVGFGAEDGLHLDIFAHSMGTQVCRSMIEQHGGADFVDRFFMAGPPNAGTRLADAKRLVTWIGTLLLNQAGPTPPALLATWALKKVSDDGLGVEDMRPTSDFFKSINKQNKPAQVAYYILAGNNQIGASEKAGAWQKLITRLQKGVDKSFDAIFSDQHDLVINVKSMHALRGEAITLADVPCDHFGYFDTPEAQAQLLGWLK